MPRLTGLGKRKIIADRLLWVATGRPENKNLLVASGLFGIILTGFMTGHYYIAFTHGLRGSGGYVMLNGWVWTGSKKP
jgi:hypothetical protein